jgi:hypothetical protein
VLNRLEVVVNEAQTAIKGRQPVKDVSVKAEEAHHRKAGFACCCQP